MNKVPMKKPVNFQSSCSIENVKETIEIQDCCRICLSEGSHGQSSANSLISPCGCKGSLEFVHEDCLGIWIKKKKKKGKPDIKEITAHQTNCQLCKEPILYEEKKKYCELNSYEEIKDKIKQKTLIFRILIFILLVFLGFLGFLIFVFTSSQIELEGNKVNKNLVMAIIGVAIFLLFISLFTFFYIFLLNKKASKIYVYDHKEK